MEAPVPGSTPSQDPQALALGDSDRSPAGDTIPFGQVFGKPQTVPFGQVFPTPAAKTVPFDQVFGKTPVPYGTAQPSAPKDDSPSLKTSGDERGASQKLLALAVAPATKLWEKLDPSTQALISGEVGPDSLVGRAGQFLNRAKGFLISGTLQGAAAWNVPGARELSDKLNPGMKIAPDNLYWNDVVDFYNDKAQKAMGLDQMPGTAGDLLRTVANVGSGVAGLAADWVLDPVMGSKVMGITKAAEEVEKVGGAVSAVTKGVDRGALNAKDRNLLSYRMPITGVGFDIKGQPIQNAIQSARELPVVKQVASAIATLSPDTGVPEIDRAQRVHANTQRGIFDLALAKQKAAQASTGLSSAENDLASTLAESVGNLKPNVPEEIIKASNGKLSLSEADARTQMAQKLPALAEKAGMELLPGRADAMVDAAMFAKKEGAGALEDLHQSGHLTAKNAEQIVLENHLPHMINPSYRGVISAEEYAAKLADDENYVKKVSEGTFMSGRDPIHRRELRMSLVDANLKMMKDTGLDGYYINDPISASTAMRLRTQKVLNDSNFIDTISKYGKRFASDRAASEEGYARINHPELNGKTILIKGPEREMRLQNGELMDIKNPNPIQEKIRVQDMYLPKDIASKAQHYMNRPALGAGLAVIRDYNQIFRSSKFFLNPGLNAMNYWGNMIKAGVWAGEDFISATKASFADLLGKWQPVEARPNGLYPNGKTYSAKEWERVVQAAGFRHTSNFQEGISDVIDNGKRISLAQAYKTGAKLGVKETYKTFKDIIGSVNLFGEKLINHSQMTLFRAMVQKGYEPEEAAAQVTKVLFDYTRNSPMTDAARFALPFIQHPIKQTLFAPELLGKNPGFYNFMQNTIPHVISNALKDPMTQAQYNSLAPDHLREKDAIAGPLLPGKSAVAKILGLDPESKNGYLVWLLPKTDMSIMNHFDYFRKGGWNTLMGEVSPLIKGTYGFFSGRGDFDKLMDNADGSPNWTARFNHLVHEAIGGLNPFPATTRLIDEKLGLENPKHFEPWTVRVINGAFGQGLHISDLDTDFDFKIKSLHYAYVDQRKQLYKEMSTDAVKNIGAADLARMATFQYPSVKAMHVQDLYTHMMQDYQNENFAKTSEQALGTKMGVPDFVARLKFISQEMKNLNDAYAVSTLQRMQMNAENKRKSKKF